MQAPIPNPAESAADQTPTSGITVDLRSRSQEELVSSVRATAERDNVEEILLSGKAVDDGLIAPLLDLPNLKRLKLENTSVGDATVNELAERNQLELFYLIDADELTAEGVRRLGAMTQLRNLRISGPAVDNKSVQSIFRLTSLAALTLQETAVTDQGIGSLEGLANLKELSLFKSPVTDEALEIIGKLPKLAKLRLRATKVTGANVEPLASMPVVDLELAETSFSNRGMPSVARMPKLEKLNLWLTDIDDEGLRHLERNTQLTLLNLDNVSGITNASLDVIAALPRLTLLHLGGTSVTPEGLSKLYSLDRLQTLFVTRLGVDESIAEQLRAELPSLQRLEY